MNYLAVDRMAEDESVWEPVRAAYPAQEPFLNLNNAAVSPPPIAVEEAVVDAYRFISRNPDLQYVEQAGHGPARDQAGTGGADRLQPR